LSWMRKGIGEAQLENCETAERLAGSTLCR